MEFTMTKEEKTAYQKQYRIDHIEELTTKSKQRYADHKEEERAKCKQYRIDHKEELAAKKKQYYIDHKVEESAARQTVNGRYTKYKSGAKQRNLSFELSKDEFASFWQKPCSYCGGEISTIGIDRIDSNKGYIKSNCRACCSICNKIKLDHNIEFINAHMTKMLKNQGLI
jgi:hypothetical protein